MERVINRGMLAIVGGLALLAVPSIGLAQSATDISELKQFVAETESQGQPPPAGTKITMANWQQYKAFLPFGMTKLFQGTYQWKMPNDVEIDIGETKIGGNLPPTFLAATEKYGGRPDDRERYDRSRHKTSGFEVAGSIGP
jgi:hypothetical protein